MDTSDGLHGRRPEAWQIAIPAIDLSVGENLSAVTAGHVESALARGRSLVEGHDA